MLLPALLALAQTGPAAQPTPCPAQVALPAELSGWFDRGQPGAIGKGFDLTATPAEASQLAIKVARAGNVATAGVDVASAGTYRVALSVPAWIDVVRGGASVASIAHTHGPACSGVAKIVDFTLAPGHYTLQLSGMKAASARVLIVRKG